MDTKIENEVIKTDTTSTETEVNTEVTEQAPVTVEQNVEVKRLSTKEIIAYFLSVFQLMDQQKRLKLASFKIYLKS